MKLILGLGNVGKEYVGTRHNAGFRVVDAVAAAHDAAWKLDTDRKASIARCTIGGTDVLFAKPTTFMNLSGDAAALLTGYYRVAPQDMLVIHDEMDLVPGTFCFSEGGGAAGHNGISSVQERFPNVAVARLRIGIGRPEHGGQSKDWVLTVPSKAETDACGAAEQDAAEAVETWISQGTAAAMNLWNHRKTSNDKRQTAKAETDPRTTVPS